MNEYKTAVTQKVAELVAKGWKLEAAEKRARKACKPLHPAHKRAVSRRMEAADTAAETTGEFHSM